MNTPNSSQVKPGIKLVLSCDLGGSQVKAIAQIYPDGIPCVLAMSPEIADVSIDSINSFSVQTFQNISTWVGVGDEYYVLGTIAKEVFAGTAALRDNKYHYAIPKIAGLLSMAYQKFGINHNHVDVFIQILLPPGEVNDARNLTTSLKQILKLGILTPNGRLKGKLRNFCVAAEGSGILTYRSRTLGKTYIQKNVGILMLGYRNASFALSAQGNPAKSESTDLGMSWVINSFVERTAVGLSKNDSRLVTAILAAAKGNFDAFRPLSRKATPSGVQFDLNLFQKVLPSIRDEYCRALVRWIRNIAVLDEILICGGTAEYVKKELTDHFHKEATPIVWNGGVQFPAPLDTNGLGERVADVWTAHITYILMLDKNFAYDRKQDLVPDPNKPRPSTPTSGLAQLREYAKKREAEQPLNS